LIAYRAKTPAATTPINPAAPKCSCPAPLVVTVSGAELVLTPAPDALVTATEPDLLAVVEIVTTPRVALPERLAVTVLFRTRVEGTTYVEKLLVVM